MLIIGERINTSRKAVNEAVGNRDAQYIQADVTSQVDSGADLVDVNAGSRRNSEVDDLFWLIEGHGRPPGSGPVVPGLYRGLSRGSLGDVNPITSILLSHTMHSLWQ